MRTSIMCFLLFALFLAPVSAQEEPVTLLNPMDPPSDMADTFDLRPFVFEEDSLGNRLWDKFFEQYEDLNLLDDLIDVPGNEGLSFEERDGKIIPYFWDDTISRSRPAQPGDIVWYRVPVETALVDSTVMTPPVPAKVDTIVGHDVSTRWFGWQWLLVILVCALGVPLLIRVGLAEAAKKYERNHVHSSFYTVGSPMGVQIVHGSGDEDIEVKNAFVANYGRLPDRVTYGRIKTVDTKPVIVNTANGHRQVIDHQGAMGYEGVYQKDDGTTEVRYVIGICANGFPDGKGFPAQKDVLEFIPKTTDNGQPVVIYGALPETPAVAEPMSPTEFGEALFDALVASKCDFGWWPDNVIITRTIITLYAGTLKLDDKVISRLSEDQRRFAEILLGGKPLITVTVHLSLVWPPFYVARFSPKEGVSPDKDDKGKEVLYIGRSPAPTEVEE